MGVPAFFRWLSRKYPAIVVHCVEEKPKVVNGVTIPIDTTTPNPNRIEFDNLYLDMNGIIHPCCHPEDKPAPKNENEMMVAIFEYIDRLFSIVRPRKLLYMAIDGVAPRAKMNQQRSRRFRASKESDEKIVEMARIREELLDKGAYLPPEKEKGEHFDSNCITPGTPFMDRLAKCLHYYVHDRINSDPGWKNIKVILSDANVPGEGEHKIMDFIRRQRANPSHDPNTHHCLCGADADLIMLGLATHEPNFTIIREEFKPNKPRPCDLCGQLGHEMKDCTGAPREKEGEFDELNKPVAQEQEFIFLRLNVLREYLERELTMHHLPFPFDIERAIDDWVFMCFFVGNDFLPHLPSLEIREGAIDRLVNLYKKAVQKTGGYLTDSGIVNLQRVQLIMTDLGEVEDEIFKRRQENEIAFKERQKGRKKRMKLMNDKPAWILGGQYAPTRLGQNPSAITNARQEAYHMRVQGMHSQASNNAANLRAAESLKAMLKEEEPDIKDPKYSDNSKNVTKRSSSEARLDSDSEEEPVDDVRLWEDGWKDRYYEHKFDVSQDNIEFRHKVAAAYTQGLCWVLRYYYQGCASWKWFFPYHYAPFASDFINIGDLSTDFEKGTKPFNPLEQLMGVFPAASKQHLPPSWGELMCDPDSPIIDFYPDDFKIDLNGKKYAWQGVALLPFVDEKRLLKAVEAVYPLLTEEERRRNVRGHDRLYVGKNHKGYSFLLSLYEGKLHYNKEFQLNPEFFEGVGGKVLLSKDVVEPDGVLHSVIPGLPDIYSNTVVCINFRDPQYPDSFIFPARRLPGAVDPGRVLKPGDLDSFASKNWYPQIGMAPATQRARLDASGHRALHHSVNRGPGIYSSIPPPQSLIGQYGSSQFKQDYRSHSQHRRFDDYGRDSNGRRSYPGNSAAQSPKGYYSSNPSSYSNSYSGNSRQSYPSNPNSYDRSYQAENNRGGGYDRYGERQRGGWSAERDNRNKRTHSNDYPYYQQQQQHHYPPQQRSHQHDNRNRDSSHQSYSRGSWR